MIFHDFECECGHLLEDVAFISHKEVTKTVVCDECGKDAPMVFARHNGIHHSHSGMYGKYHAGFGCVVESYSHKQQLLNHHKIFPIRLVIFSKQNHSHKRMPILCNIAYKE